MTKLAAILCVAAATAPAIADRGPTSLRMRGLRRVAQIRPDAQPDDAPPDAQPDDAPPDAPAQPTPAPRPPPPHAPESPLPAPVGSVAPTIEDGKTEVISITDSIEHELFTGRAPVTVVTRGDLAASGRATLGDILQGLPAQSNGGNAQVNAGGDGTTRMNLRGLGAPRTLVLLNGRRLVNGGPGADSSVDVNTIPLAMIERVEILKDGASALYGADAVGGVVNLVTRPQFNGTDASLLTSTSQRGDGAEIDASVVSGFRTDDKSTYFVVSAGYQRHTSVLAGDRAFSAFQDSYNFATKTVTRNLSLAGSSGRLDASSIGGGMPLSGCASDICKPDGNGGWTDFATPGDLYNEAPGNYLYTPSSRYTLLATGGNRLNKHTAFFSEVLYQSRNADRQLSPVAFIADAPISKDSIYNPFGADVLDYRRRLPELGSREFVDELRTVRLVVGLTGNVPETADVLAGWSYETSITYGDTHAAVATTGQLFKPHLADALGPSMLDATGVPICVRVPGDPMTQIVYKIKGSGTKVVEVPCVPLNLFAQTIPRDQLAALSYTDAGVGEDSLTTVLGTASGRIAKLPNHGDISASTGADYRYELGTQAPPSVASSGDSTDNLQQATTGEFHLAEGFGELAIVPLVDPDSARRVELDLGARVLHHNRFGSALTYKAGGLFRIVRGFAARGTYATAFRAPSVFDLYAGRTQRTPAAEDPCDTKPPSVGDGTKTLDPMVQAECTAQGVPAGSRFTTNQQISEIGGNPELRAETASTLTAGVVFEPRIADGLAMSADYWHITIHDAIETLGIQTIFANCYDRGLSEFCDQIHRDPYTHRIRPVDQLLQNIRRTTMSGIDFAIWDDTKLGGLGRIHAGFEAQYLVQYDLLTSQQVVHGAGFYDLGVYPRFKANLASQWFHPSGVSGGFRLRFVGSYKECASNDCNNADYLRTQSRDIGAYAKVDLFGGYDFGAKVGRSSVQVGINNLFDATPPIVYNAAAANSDAASYDFVGRLVYLRLAQQF